MVAVTGAGAVRACPSGGAGGIDRRSRLSTREFIEEYALPQRPVIVTDAARDWPAMRRFSFAFFRER